MLCKKLAVNGVPTGRRFWDFVKWFYGQIETPVIRGSVFEYLLVDHLIQNAALIAGSRISFHWGAPAPSQEDLEQSLDRYYNKQPHGDVFDVQLHWGLTVEIKTTASEQWSIEKTSNWDIWIDQNLDEKGFQAQYYILAKLDSAEVVQKTDLIDFSKVKFYVLSGRELDKKVGKNKSIGLNRFVHGLSAFNLSKLAFELQKVANYEMDRIKDKFNPGWGGLSYKKENDGCIPIARDTPSGISRAWYRLSRDQLETDKVNEEINKISKELGKVEILRKKRELCNRLWIKSEEIPDPWIDGYKPSPRDWAVAGLIYLDHRD